MIRITAIFCAMLMAISALAHENARSIVRVDLRPSQTWVRITVSRSHLIEACKEEMDDGEVDAALRNRLKLVLDSRNPKLINPSVEQDKANDQIIFTLTEEEPSKHVQLLATLLPELPGEETVLLVTSDGKSLYEAGMKAKGQILEYTYDREVVKLPPESASDDSAPPSSGATDTATTPGADSDSGQAALKDNASAETGSTKPNNETPGDLRSTVPPSRPVVPKNSQALPAAVIAIAGTLALLEIWRRSRR